MGQELLISDLTRAANELVGDSLPGKWSKPTRDLDTSGAAESRRGPAETDRAQTAWLSDRTTLAPALGAFERLTAAAPRKKPPPARRSRGQIEAWAIDTVHREWFRICNWKDQVRQQRGPRAFAGRGNGPFTIIKIIAKKNGGHLRAAGIRVPTSPAGNHRPRR